MIYLELLSLAFLFLYFDLLLSLIWAVDFRNLKSSHLIF